MTSTQVDIDSEMKNMVMCFRVSELQVLLGHAGRNKSGRKHELMSRALQLIRSSGTNSSIRSKIVDLYGKRFPHSLSRNQEMNRDNGHQRDISHNNNNSEHPKEEDKCVNVKFSPLPFYEFVSDVLKPSPLFGYNGRLIKEERFIFHFTSQQVHELNGNRPMHDAKRYLTKHSALQVQFRICVLDTSTEQPDQLPQNLNIKVNSIAANLPPFVPPTKAGVDPKRPNRPINITTLCYGSSYHSNVLDIRWSADSGKNYVAVINIVRQVTAEDLHTKLKKRAIIPASQSRSIIQRKLAVDSDSDISTTSLEVSLLCPLGKMRMSLPIRPQTCNHLQCFDALLFLKMNEKKPTWKCPVCDKPAPFKSLVVDEMFTKILESCNSEEITFKQDGSWHTSHKKTETLVIGTPMKPIVKAAQALPIKVVIDLSTEVSPPRVAKGREAVKPKQQGKSAEKRKLVKLKDLSHTGSKISRMEEKKKVEPEVIDLTCDSSDDEPLSPVKLPSRSPLQISDDAAMSVSSSPIDLGSPSNNSRLLEVPSRRNLPLRGHPSISHTTPPYARSPNPQRNHSPNVIRKLANSHSPSFETYHRSSPHNPYSNSPRPNHSPLYVPASPAWHPASPLVPPRDPSPDTNAIPGTHRPPVISHSSPTYLHNGMINTPPTHAPSPLISATPPGYPPMDLNLPQNGYNTPPLSMFASQSEYLGFPYPLDSSLPSFRLPIFADYLRGAGIFPPVNAELYARAFGQQSNSTPTSSELRARQMPAPYGDDKLNYSNGGIL